MNFSLPQHIQFGRSLTAPIEHSLSDSGAEGVSLHALLSLSGQSMPEVTMGYCPMAGSEALRKAIVKYHTGKAKAELISQTIGFSGAQEAIFCLMASILEPQDEVLVFTPCYPSLASLPEQFAAKTICIPLREEQQWQLDLNALEQNLSNKTKLIIINTPHNPTGSIINAQQAKQVKAMAERVGAYVLADEVSAQSDYHRLGLSGLFVDYPRSVTLGVLSKSLGLAGIRVGWAICGNAQLAEQLLAVKAHLSICGSATDDTLATIALEHSEALLKSNHQVISKNMALMSEFVSAHQAQLSWQPPQAGMLSLLKVHSDMPAQAFSKAFAERHNTLLLPAQLFSMQSEQHFRLGLGKRNFQQALVRFENYLSTYVNLTFKTLR
ncbi:aminotransferase class I/II-fold pyridoxal phosphate-dependent enzyme [Pseudoalteromonas sp. T1lg65]|uniref:aminotransferase class I/II-fold pyridoxal phosphate-dependent enzyme n=1 Tax=Pseudoalteromonas sp. T1lg65 TaxID=2077101 RepID=UPI003F791E11